jgi:glutamate racemase
LIFLFDNSHEATSYGKKVDTRIKQNPKKVTEQIAKNTISQRVVAYGVAIEPYAPILYVLFDNSHVATPYGKKRQNRIKQNPKKVTEKITKKRNFPESRGIWRCDRAICYNSLCFVRQ